MESSSLELFKSHLDMVLGNGSRWPCLIVGPEDLQWPGLLILLDCQLGEIQTMGTSSPECCNVSSKKKV